MCYIARVIKYGTIAPLIPVDMKNRSEALKIYSHYGSFTPPVSGAVQRGADWHLNYTLSLARLNSGETGNTSFVHPTMVLTLHKKPVEGAVVVEGHGKVDIAPVYSMRFFPAGQHFSNTWQGEVVSMMIALDNASYAGFSLPNEFRIFYDQWATSIAQNVKSSAERGYLDPLLMDSSVLSLFSRLFELEHGRKSEAGIGRIRQSDLDEFILDRMEEHIRVGDVSHYLGVEPMALNALFKANFDTTPYGYIQEVRMRRAKDMLSNSSESLAGIAMSLGFSDQSHFNRVFRKHTGFTPATYRRVAC